jgi:YD repeat-containing protein
LLLLVFALTFCAGVGSARSEGYSWRTEGGVRELLDEGVVLGRWAPKQWAEWEQEVRGIAECLGRASGCASAIIRGETAVSGPTAGMADDAEAVVKAAREAGPSLSGGATEHLVDLGISAGTLPENTEFSVSLWQKEYALGVEIGNGMKESLRIPEWKIEPADGKCERPVFEYPRAGLETSEYNILKCSGVRLWEAEPSYISPTRLTECFGHNSIEECEYWYKRYFNEAVEFYAKYESNHSYLEEPPSCTRQKVGEEEGTVYVSILRDIKCVPPLEGIPTPGPLTAEQKEINSEHGVLHSEMPGVKLPSAPPSKIEESEVLKFTEERALLELIRKHSTHEANAQGEAEEGFGFENVGAPNRRRCYAGWPVDCATGNQVVSQTDLSVGSRGPSFGLAPTYNSQLAVSQSQPGPFGYGWSASYSDSLTFNEEVETITVHQDNGSAIVFETGTSGRYVPLNGGVEATLVKEGSNYVYTLPDQTALHFNSTGQLTSETDRNGNTLTMAYESKGRLESITGVSGRKITLAYNAEGQVESAKDPMGHTVKYTYESGNLASVTLPGEEKARWKYKYNSEHELTSETDGREHTITTEYNEAHQVVSQTDAMSRKRTWKYTPIERGTETTITEPSGSTTIERFNEYGSPTSVTRASGTSIAATTTYEYNEADELTATIDPNKHRTEYGYDSAGNLTSEKNAGGDEKKWTYDSKHDIETETTPDGETTTIKRNSAGDPEVIERPAPGSTTQKTTYKYDADGDVESMTNPLERTWKYEYDAYGDRKAETDPEGNKRTWEYNEDSQEIATVSPRGNASGAKASEFTTKTERDAQGRPLKITDPLGHTTKYTYDGDGNVETVTDGNSHTTKYTYDADNELTRTEEPNKAVTEAEYDSMGQVKSQTDGNKHVTKYVRNLLEETEEVVNPLGKKTLKEYDPAGNLIKLTDPKGRTTTYTYDPANRLTEVSYSSGNPSTVKYEYNKDGERTKMIDGTGTTIYVYDQLDRMTESESGHKEVIKYEYNLGNQQAKITYPNTKAIERVYDKDGRLEKVVDWNKKETKFAYDEDSDLKTITFPSETKDVDTYAYNDADQMSEVKMKKSSETLGSLVYTRDDDGQVKKTTSKDLPGAEVTENTYDENNRLTKSGTTEYKYDSANNPTKEGSSTNTYNEGDELEKGTGVTYSYDELGERTKTTPEKGPATTYG